jgi:hypothetical protein
MVPSGVQAEVYLKHSQWKRDHRLLASYLLTTHRAKLAVAQRERYPQSILDAIGVEIADLEAKDGQ